MMPSKDPLRAGIAALIVASVGLLCFALLITGAVDRIDAGVGLLLCGVLLLVLGADRHGS